MSQDDFDNDIGLDHALAERLAGGLPDIADDGFTAAVMGRLRAPAPRYAQDETPWLFGSMLALALVCAFVWSSGGADPGIPTEALRELPLMLTEHADRMASAWVPALRDAMADHLSTIVAAALCLFTLLTPALLED